MMYNVGLAPLRFSSLAVEGGASRHAIGTTAGHKTTFLSVIVVKQTNSINQ
jgi:hypothetical protein